MDWVGGENFRVVAGLRARSQSQASPPTTQKVTISQSHPAAVNLEVDTTIQQVWVEE